MKRSRIVATALVLAVSFASAQKNETVPTASPNSTIAPTPAPNSTVPTMAPNSTVPTMAPNSTVPTMAPNSTVPTAAPVDPPTPQPTKKYVPPVEPTAAPTSPLPPSSPPRFSSFMKLVGRTIGWLIFLGLSVLVFGALMSNRYRIYYVLRGVWYSFLRLNCTRWIIRKVRGGRGPSANTSLNEIIFDQNDLNEGLLLNDNNQ